MFSKVAIPAAVAMASFTSALPTSNFSRAAVQDTYTFFQGDGSVAAGWPSVNDWADFDGLWEANLPLIQKACSNNNFGIDNSDEETALIKTHLVDVAQEANVDSRVALAIMMQESKGCVRVPTTDNGVKNPGLFQTHNGIGSCDGLNPCPEEQIVQMIRDGLLGTADGAGIQQTTAQATTELGATAGDAQSVYGGARIYNSGSLTPTDLNDGRGSTKCYAVDVANRLTGFTLATSSCQNA